MPAPDFAELILGLAEGETRGLAMTARQNGFHVACGVNLR